MGQAPSERPQGVEHPGVPRVSTEEDQSPPVPIEDVLVVDQRASQLEETAKQRHVVGLSLRRVRKTQVSAPANQGFRRDLLDAQDRFAAGQVVRDIGAGLTEGIVGERPAGVRLHGERDPVAIDQRADMVRRQRYATLPLILVLATNSDHDVRAVPVIPQPGSREKPGPNPVGFSIE